MIELSFHFFFFLIYFIYLIYFNVLFNAQLKNAAETDATDLL